MTTQKAFYFDVSACTGCKACQVACQDHNRLSADVLWRRVFHYGGGSWLSDDNIPYLFRTDNVYSYSVSITCMHCEIPLCKDVCPTNAITKRDDGVVLLETSKCIGCRYCEWACPYGAPCFDEEAGVMTKCTFCEDRLAKGQNPACVDACPMRCLDFGELEELRQKYGDLDAIEPLPAGDITKPAFVVSRHIHTRLSGEGDGKILNLPEEV
jgi:anaerobic dimethyl sulfoxide reductase subunit B (iron-sulfur subunit)